MTLDLTLVRPGPLGAIKAAGALPAPDLDPDASGVRSVDRAAALLLALGETTGATGVTELARRIGLHKSTASRLLATLERRGLVEQDADTGKYRLGIAVIRLAERAERMLDLGAVAGPDLSRLARETRESVSLAVLAGGRVSVVARVDGRTAERIDDRADRSAPVHATAAGKLLLAALPERDVLRFSRLGLTSFTTRTITELEPLLEDLARTRRRGWSVSLGELDPRVHGVAVAVRDARGAVTAALEIRGPAARLEPARLADLAERARATATAIGIRLGGLAAG